MSNLDYIIKRDKSSGKSRLIENRHSRGIEFTLIPDIGDQLERDDIFLSNYDMSLPGYERGSDFDRRDRLSRVIGYLTCALCRDYRQIKEDFGLLGYDHKGKLTSVWMPPSGDIGDILNIANYTDKAWFEEGECDHDMVVIEQNGDYFEILYAEPVNQQTLINQLHAA